MGMKVGAELLWGRYVRASANSEELFAPVSSTLGSPDTNRQAVLERLQAARVELALRIHSELGYTDKDAHEIIEGVIEFTRAFREPELGTRIVDNVLPNRQLRISYAPVGVVLVVLPSNAFLSLSVIAALNAVSVGCPVVLRVPQSSPETGKLLAKIFEGSSGISIVQAPAGELIDSFLDSSVSGLLHYFGSSRRIPDLARRCAEAGKGLVGEGEGNTWVYLDDSVEPAEAARQLAEGALRFHGETCTSINGAIIHPAIFERVKASLIPLFQAIEMDVPKEIRSLGSKSGSELLVDQPSPLLMEDPDGESGLVREGFFGSALWIRSGDYAEFRSLWRSNRFPLCAAYWGKAPDDLVTLENVARLVINGDPSIEDPLEPWGAYGRSGISRVEEWHLKYVRPFQLDEPSK